MGSEEVKKIFSNKKLRWGIVIFLVLLFGVPIIRHCAKPKPSAPGPRPVETAIAFQKNSPLYIDTFGTLGEYYDVDIVSQVTGEIKEEICTSGAFVKKGDLLYTIDPKEYEAELEKAVAALAQDEIDLKMKTDTFERNKQLFEKNLISKQDFENYQTEMAAAVAQVQLDKANVRLAEINLGYCTIRAPMAGVLGECIVDPGNIVTANSGPMLVNLKVIDPIFVYFDLTETDLLRVRKAMDQAKLQVNIIVKDDPDSPYKGTLDFMNNVVDDNTGTIQLRGIVKNPDYNLWSGQFVDVRLILDTIKNATLVPYEAVKIGNKGHYLFVVTDKGTADLRQITIGQREGDDIIIKKGVKLGETVVTVGQMGLSPGVPVEDQTKEKAEAEKSGKQKSKQSDSKNK